MGANGPICVSQSVSVCSKTNTETLYCMWTKRVKQAKLHLQRVQNRAPSLAAHIQCSADDKKKKRLELVMKGVAKKCPACLQTLDILTKGQGK
eukprot:1596943-Rhodomonas_salina.2